MKFTPLRPHFATAILTFSVFCGCMAPIPALAQEARESNNQPSVVEELNRAIEKFEQNSDASIKDFLDERQKTYYILSSLLNSTDNQAQCSAAFLLGRGHYEEAVFPLWRIITLKDKKKPSGYRVDAYKELWQEYPAAEALVAIGKPSTRLMLQNLESSDDELVRELSLKIIRDVEGVEVAQFLIERAITKQQIPAKKERLKNALSALPKLKFGLRPNFFDIFRD